MLLHYTIFYKYFIYCVDILYIYTMASGETVVCAGMGLEDSAELVAELADNDLNS